MTAVTAPPGSATYNSRVLSAFDLFQSKGRAEAIFNRRIGSRVAAAARGSSTGRARVYGEIVDVLRVKGRRDYALELEDIWTELAESVDFTLMCGYGGDALQNDPDAWDYIACHDAVLPAPLPEEEESRLERAVNKALGARAWMVRALIVGETRLSRLPYGQAASIWLRRHMPLAAQRAVAALGR